MSPLATEVGHILPGAVYQLHELRAVLRGGVRVIEDVLLGKYRIEGFALDLITFQERVLFQSLDGAHPNRLYVTSLYDFAQRFRPVATAPVPQKAAGTIPQGSGV